MCVIITFFSIPLSGRPYVCSPCSEKADVFVFYSVTVYVSYSVYRGKEVGCCEGIVVSRYDQDFLLFIFEGLDEVFCFYESCDVSA
jgi:hypothetical protein